MTWKLEIHHLDVGQGDSTLILVKELVNNQVLIRKSVLIDGGPSSEGPTVAQYVQNTCGMKLDIIILSHNHNDHYGGLLNLRDYYQQAYQQADKYTPSEVTTKKKGFRGFQKCDVDRELLGLGPSITMTCIASNKVHNNANWGSLAFLIQFGNFRYYTGGDLEGPHENEVIRDQRPVHALNQRPVHAFKAGHHGSKLSAQGAFLDNTQPTVAIISAGFYDEDAGIGNAKCRQYDHPSKDILQRLNNHLYFQTCYLTSCSLISPGIIEPNPQAVQTGRFRVAGFADENPANFRPGNIVLTIEENQAASNPVEFHVTYYEASSGRDITIPHQA
ncbi:hypothetical protein KKHLCK_16980 [Candidatus Electrothrix laxa]